MNLLKSSIEKHCPDSALTADERHRNRVGKVFCYTYDAAVTDTVPSCNRDIGLPNIVKCNSRVDVLENHSVSTVSFKPELILVSPQHTLFVCITRHGLHSHYIALGYKNPLSRISVAQRSSDGEC